MRSGVYRIVFFIGRTAFKVPRLRNLFQGMRCNRWEREVWQRWRPIFGWENLCPIKFADPFGFLVAMHRASQPITFDEVVAAHRDYYPSVTMEMKPENFGRIAGEVVVLDYGLHEQSLVTNQRTYYGQMAAAL